MKKNISVIVLSCLAVWYLSVIKGDMKLNILLIALSTLIIFSISEYYQSYKKIKALYKLNISITIGLAYCMAILPIIIGLMKKTDRPYVMEQLFVSVIIFFYAIFNYGIRVKETV